MKKDISRLMLKRFQHTQVPLPEYNPTADFDWIQKKSRLPWLELDIHIPTDVILNELPNIKHLLVAHRDQYNEHEGWKSFCIHGKSYDATREHEYYNDNRSLDWTPEALELLPNTVNFMQNWPGQDFGRIRVMLLEPHGYISIHRDYAESQLLPINIAITQPDGCRFVMENYGCVPFAPGKAFWLDISNNHVVFNDSDEPRWHLIIHQNPNKQFQNMVVNSYNKVYNN